MNTKKTETFFNIYIQSFAMNEFAKWRRRYCPFYEHAVKIGSSID